LGIRALDRQAYLQPAPEADLGHHCGVFIAEQLLYAVVGPAQFPLNVPKTFAASFVFGRAAIEKYRVLATVVASRFS
jgi:hypothetical protein